MERTIKVTGRGKLAVRPDVTRLLLRLEGTRREYNEALELSARMTEELKTVLETFSFDRKALKTLNFSIDSKYRSETDQYGNWKQVFEGYCFTHQLKAEFPSDNARLGNILRALGSCTAEPEIRLEYTVSDPESAKKELLAKAVADSRTKAGILAAAAGVALGEILTVDYSWAELEFVSRPMEADMKCFREALPGDSCSLDIEADDISMTDTVTVVWRIA